MKLKSRWIEKYNLECDEKLTTRNVICNTSAILKAHVKPKVLWFIRHVFSKNTRSQCGLEEGEIVSDDDYGDDGVNKKQNPNYEATNHGMSGCGETIGATNKPENNANFSRGKYKNDFRENYGHNFRNVTVSYKKLSKQYSHPQGFYHRKPFNERLRNPSTRTGH